MLIFLDTEFTGFNEPKLISLGLVTAATQEFYVEVPFPFHACSDFVQEAVIPLLGQYPDCFCPLPDLRLRILSWLEIVRRNADDIQICFDYQGDWDLFSAALDHRVPPWCKQRHIRRNINKLMLWDFYKRHNLPEHHALYDAMANRYAYRERIPATT